MAVQAFTVDNDGNIIMTRGAWDHLFLYCDTCDYHQQECSPENGLITGFNILVGDTGGLRKLRCSIPEPTSLKNYQLLKFSPHFDSLIATAYYFEMSPDDTVVSHISLSDLHSVKTDSRNRVYVTGSIVNDASYRNAFNLAIPNSDNLILDVQEANNTTGFLIQYDSRLVAQRIAQLKGVNNNSQFTMNSTFHCINFDEDSNVVILIDVGKTTDDMNDDRYFLYDTTRLDIGLTTCFLRIDTVWNYLSSGQINSPSSISRLNKRVKQYDIAVQNNRIMAQVRYWNSLATIDSTFITSGRSHGLITWDYDGHCISFIDYHSPSLNTEMGGTILRDSILYLSGTFQDGATLQDFSVPSNGYCNAYIAKYVDAAFMTPYIYIESRAENIITWNQNLNYTVNESPVILNAIASSGLPILYTVSDTSIATAEGDVLTLLREGSCNIVASQPGDNYYLPATPIVKTLVVEHTGINQISNHTFNVYPNPTNGTVVINTDGESISNVYLTTSVGQRHRMAVNGNLISLEGFPSGVYYLQVITDKNIYKQKIIKL